MEKEGKVVNTRSVLPIIFEDRISGESDFAILAAVHLANNHLRRRKCVWLCTYDQTCKVVPFLLIWPRPVRNRVHVQCIIGSDMSL
jgi:hypothetical protein